MSNPNWKEQFELRLTQACLDDIPVRQKKILYGIIETEIIEKLIEDVRPEIGNGSRMRELRAKWLGKDDHAGS